MIALKFVVNGIGDPRQVEMKTRKLRKLMARYQQSKNDINALRTELQDTIHEFQRERADMFLSLRSLDQQLQLKNFLIDVSWFSVLI